MTPPNRRDLRGVRWTEHEVGIAVLSFDIAPAQPPDKTEPRESRIAVNLLTPAQRKVCALAVRGRTNAEIAVELGIAVRTVANHIAAILKKTGATSRFDLARRFDG